MRDEAQRGAVGGPLVVVLGVPAHHLGRVVVTQALEESPELVLGEQEEEQHGVGLLGQLVLVRVVALGAQDAVETLDVAVLLAVVVPVELLEVLVALELADEPVAVERDEHLVAHLAPLLDLFVGEADGLARSASRRRSGRSSSTSRAISESQATMTLV